MINLNVNWSLSKSCSVADMWRQLVSSSAGVAAPMGRSSHSITAIAKKVYIFSGEKEPRVPVGNDLHCYDLDTGAWSLCQASGSAPSPRVGHASAALGSKLYIFGGRTEVMMGEGLLDDLHCYDTNSGEWSQVKTTGDTPPARSYHALVSTANKLYLFGGCSQDRHNDLYSYDPEACCWSQLPSHEAIKPRGGPGLAAVGHHLYVTAGFTGTEADDMHRFDIKTNTWETLNPQPNIPPISVFGITTLGTRMVIFGGELKPSAQGHAGAGGFSSDVYQYDTHTPGDGWQKVAISGGRPSPRGWLPTTATQDGEIVVFGGLSPDNERLADMWALTL